MARRPVQPDQLNRYVYANADPVNMHDPTGLEALAQQGPKIAVNDTLLAIRGMSAVRAQALIQLAVNSVIVSTILTVDHYIRAAIANSSRNDGIDSDGPRVIVPEIEVGGAGEQDPELQRQPEPGGAGMGLPPTCPPAVYGRHGATWEDLREFEERTRDEAFRRAGIPEGLEPIDILQVNANVQYVFVMFDVPFVVTFQAMDSGGTPEHDAPHWDWGNVKLDKVRAT